MTDPRIEKLAHLLVNYSVARETGPPAGELFRSDAAGGQGTDKRRHHSRAVVEGGLRRGIEGGGTPAGDGWLFRRRGAAVPLRFG